VINKRQVSGINILWHNFQLTPSVVNPFVKPKLIIPDSEFSTDWTTMGRISGAINTLNVIPDAVNLQLRNANIKVPYIPNNIAQPILPINQRDFQTGQYEGMGIVSGATFYATAMVGEIFSSLAATSTVVETEIESEIVLTEDLTEDTVDTDVASMAKSWQGKGAYPGVDDWTNTTIKQGTKVWGGAPGQSNFYTTEEVMQEVGTDATKLNQGLQVGKGSYPQFRPGMTQYEVTQNIPAGYSQALANPQFGQGGFGQYYINDYENVLNPILSRIMTNK
jgi:hypothetical protein